MQGADEYLLGNILGRVSEESESFFFLQVFFFPLTFSYVDLKIRPISIEPSAIGF